MTRSKTRGTAFVEIADTKLIRSNEKAGLFQIDGAEHWIPWRVLSKRSIDRDGQTGTIYVAESFALVAD